MNIYVFLSSRAQARPQKVPFWPQANTTMKNTRLGVWGVPMSAPTNTATAKNRCRRTAAQGFGGGAHRPQGIKTMCQINQEKVVKLLAGL